MSWWPLVLPFVFPCLVTVWLAVLRLRRQQTEEISHCSHWPRDPVTLSDGTEVAFICRKCDKQVYSADYIFRGHR